MREFKLILLRHADAERHSSGDHARPLSDYGILQCQHRSDEFLRRCPSFDGVIYSDARRTTETAQKIFSYNSSGFKKSDFRLYSLGGVDEFSKILMEHIPEQASSVIIVGHNPGISAVASEFSGELINLGTAEYVILTLRSESWEQALTMSGCWDRCSIPM